MATPIRQGISRLSVIVGLVCVLILVAITLPLVDRYRRLQHSMKDSAQLAEIHQSWLSFAGTHKGHYPTPGLVDRLPDATLGDIDGIGPEDSSLNTTANLYSAMIAQEYFDTDILVSPLERNPVVTEDRDYNYSAYDPSIDVYWDSTFVADLETGSNVSYAHTPWVGDRLVRHWRDTRLAVLSNRGPADGIASADSYSCRSDGSYFGSQVFADHHFEAHSATRGARIGGLPVVFGMDRAGIAGEDGPTHHGGLDIAYMLCIPGMTVTAPKDGSEMLALLRLATEENDGPWSVRWPRAAVPEEVPDLDAIERIEPYTWEVLRSGGDCVILATGTMVLQSVAAAEALDVQGIRCTVVNCRFLKPYDRTVFEQMVREHPAVLTVEEAQVSNGFGAFMTREIHEIDLAVTPRIASMGMPDEFIEHGARDGLLATIGLDADGIAARVKRLVASHSTLDSHSTVGA